jgi:hypothetical protein
MQSSLHFGNLSRAVDGCFLCRPVSVTEKDEHRTMFGRGKTGSRV